MQPLVAPILTLPLSPELLEALHALSSIPSIATPLRSRVLDLLSAVIAQVSQSVSQ